MRLSLQGLRKSADRLYRRARLELSRPAETRQPEMDLDTAIRLYGDYLRDHPYSIIFLPLANLLRLQSRFDEAIRACQEGLRIFSGYSTARTALGLAWRDKGDCSRARTELEKVVAVMPDNVLARRVLGEIYHREGQVERALAHWRAIAALFPEHAATGARVLELEQELEARLRPPAPGEVPEQAEAAVAAVCEPGETVSPRGEVREVETQEAPAAAVEDEEALSVAGFGGPFVEVEEEVRPEQTVLQGVEEAVSFRGGQDYLRELPELVETLEEPLEEGVQVPSPGRAEPLAEEPPDAQTLEAPAVEGATRPPEVREGPAEVAEEFFLIPTSREEDHPSVVEEAFAEEEPVEDSRQRGLSFGEVAAMLENVPTPSLGELYEAQGRFDEAMEIYRGLLEADPSRDDLRRKLEGLTGMRDRAAEAKAAESLVEPGQARPVAAGRSPFFIWERTSERGVRLKGDSFIHDGSGRAGDDYQQREEAARVVAELERWLGRLRRREA